MSAPSRWDSIPRLDIRFRRHRLAAWTALGQFGAGVCILVFVATCSSASITPAAIGGSIGVSLMAFVAWRAVCRRWRDGRYVLLEYAMLVVASTAGVAVGLDQPIGAILDRCLTALMICFALGRIGCLFHGCCHGQPARSGLRYPWLAPWLTGSPWVQLRLFPLQLVEILLLAALAILGAGLIVYRPSMASSFLPVAYAVSRFEIERWRGDVRRYIGPLSHNQWWCISITLVVLAVGDAHIALAGIGVIALLFVARIGRLAPTIAVSSRQQLTELDDAVAAARDGKVTSIGAVTLHPSEAGIRVEPGTSTLSTGAARALERVIAGQEPRSDVERAARDHEQA